MAEPGINSLKLPRENMKTGFDAVGKCMIMAPHFTSLVYFKE